MGNTEPPPSSDSSPPTGENPIVDAYAALEAGDYGSLSSHIAALEEARAARPEGDSRLAFYAGAMHLWQAIGSDAPGERLNGTLSAIERFETASMLDSRDPHAHAFWGIAEIVLGNVLRDEDRIQRGGEVLERAIPLYEPYVHGVRIQAYGVLPRQHALFPRALEALDVLQAACNASEQGAFTYPDDGAVPPACSNAGVVAHVWEGMFLVGGDVLAKAGDAERARTYYEMAKQSPTYSDWPFASVLEARIEDVEHRTALYLDDNPTNDPQTWVEDKGLCVGCHQVGG